MSIVAIVAVDENWGIGNKGELLISLPEDQKQNFKVKTLGHPVIYGRKTLDTFPGGRLLPGRPNFILSRNPELSVEGATVFHSVDEAVEYMRKDPDETFFIIGGEQIYKQFLPYCDKCIVSKIHKSFPADAFFPDLDKQEEWKLLSREASIHSIKGVSFSIWTYMKK
ncbi:MAG: dihydrofolate reductase [Clostridiales bacterium]|nr:dihydrofolate reductase [Clostridiales bacterium]